MAATSGTQIPKPVNEQDFESNCVVLWQCILDDPNVTKVGRRGQGQHGLDIFGYRNQNVRKRVGVQCKLRNGRKGLTEKEVRDEFKMALEFKPELTEYLIATTAPDDIALQQLAFELADEQLDTGREILFYVWGWETLSDKIAQHPKAMRAFDPTYGVHSGEILAQVGEVRVIQQHTRTDLSQGFSQIGGRFQEVVRQNDQILAAIGEATITTATAVEVQLDAEIDNYRDLSGEGKPLTAISQLKKMLGRVGSTASSRTLFRIKANIASALINSGELDDGATLLLEAFAHAPDEPKAIANKGFALLLQGNWQDVLEMGKVNLVTQKADEHLSSHVIQAARFDPGIEDPMPLIPEKDRESIGVLNAYAFFLRSRNDARWEEIAAKAAEKSPDDPFAERLSAEASLEALCWDAAYLHSGKLDADQQEALAEAIAKLESIWRKMLSKEGKLLNDNVAVACNLLLGYRIGGNHNAAMALVREALPLVGDDPDFLLRSVAAALEVGDELFDELLPKLPASPEKSLLSIQLAVSRGNWSYLNGVAPSVFPTLPESERQLCELAVALARIALGRSPTMERDIRLLVEQDIVDPRVGLLLAQFCDAFKYEDLAKAAWDKSIGLIDDRTHHSGRETAALYAARKGYWTDVADLLHGRVNTVQNTELLRGLAAAVVNETPIRDRAFEFFDALPSDVRSLPYFVRSESLMHFNRGALSEAEALTRRLLEIEPDLAPLTTLIVIARRQHRNAEVASILGRNDLLEIPGAPHEKMVIAHELSRLDRGAEALGFAYSVLRANPNDPDVAKLYVVLILGSEGRVVIPSHSAVAVNTWVRLVSDGRKDQTFVIENAEQEDPSGGFLTPMHYFAQRTLGKAVDETFVEERALGDQPVWKCRGQGQDPTCVARPHGELPGTVSRCQRAVCLYHRRRRYPAYTRAGQKQGGEPASQGRRVSGASPAAPHGSALLRSGPDQLCRVYPIARIQYPRLRRP
ncbi:hypothetical protein [Rhizobium sp. L245/93]|uniref:hypothetical protein n=1 Tax=Rhizobium sp. L245/93 TaxID=2819998 RepID=UPI001ADD4D3E|nr:hypothetical protein [Rhizobium sp. L245/93]MBO9170035.1 hypothetical protein [Rhizobium sp. L245/93]